MITKQEVIDAAKSINIEPRMIEKDFVKMLELGLIELKEGERNRCCILGSEL